jgi:hypothetical protein
VGVRKAPASALARSLRRARIAVAAILAMLAMLGSGRPLAQADSAHSAPPSSRARTAVTGTVVDKDARPLPRQLVFEGGRGFHTDVDGRFTLPDVPGRYDLTILTPSEGLVTIYRGLSRRDPTLRHDLDRRLPWVHKAKVSGVVSGGGPYPLRSTTNIRFVSTRAGAEVLIGGEGRPPGPDWGPIEIGWDGPDKISGDVIALQLGSDEKLFGAGSKAWFARAPLAIGDGDVTTVALAMKEVPVVERPAPVIDMDGNYPLPDSHENYRIVGVGWVSHGGGPFGRRNPVYGPDLGPFGITWCTEAQEWNPYIRTGRTRCGGSLTAPVSLYLKAGPKFSAPRRNTPGSPSLRFAWSAVGGGVYVLELAGEHRGSLPQISIYTTATSERWPDLSALGLSFPKPRASYNATVTAIGPFETLDQAAGPDGLAAPVRKDAWWGMSQELPIPIRPALRPDVAACQYPAGESIVCGKLPNGDREFYVLSAINNKIAEYPRFADAIGIWCVRDCATARAYRKGYDRYRKENPGFDDDQPVGDIGEPPPLPRELRRKPGE